VEEEGTASTFRGLLEVFTKHGLPSSLYTDRDSHYFFTPKAGEAVDKRRLTQVGRALERLGIEHIPAYSPEARGRCERMFATLQDRLPKELAGIGSIEAANRFIREVYLPAHNARFARSPQIAERFGPLADPSLLTEILCIEEERMVARDNTITHGGAPAAVPWAAADRALQRARDRDRRGPDQRERDTVPDRRQGRCAPPLAVAWQTPSLPHALSLGHL
jgi:hypothetical protein